MSALSERDSGVSHISERRFAVVTGPTAGIGRVYVERLAERGYDLLLVSRDAERLASVAAELEARHGIRARVQPTDLGDEAATEALAAMLEAEPRVDLLVNNAGFGTTGTIARTDPGSQQRMVRVHCMAPVRLVQAVLPGMVARRSGAIVNVASIAAFVTAPGNATYSAAKAFIRTFSDGIAADMVGSGIYVQALCPGFTRTEFHQRMNTSTTTIANWLWLSADEVVAASLRALDRKGPVNVIPAWRYRVILALFRHLPLRVVTWVEAHGPRTRTRA